MQNQGNCQVNNQVKEVYEQVRMPEKCSRRIERAMQGRQEVILSILPFSRRISRPAAALIAALLILMADGTVYAATGEGIISRVFSFANNAVFTKETDEEGNNISTAAYNTSDATAPAEYKEGRLWFTANGENIDITDQVSESMAYTYRYTDAQGITHYLIVGGEPETFGYAEFMCNESGTREWIGGYFSSGKVGESINPDWLQNAKEELGIPWP